MIDSDDLTLLRRWCDHRADEDFAELVRRHAVPVREACRRRLRDPAGADDAAQAVFLILARRAPGIVRSRWWSRPVIGDWLHRTAQHVCSNHERQRRRRERHEREAAMAMAAASEPSPAELERIRERVDAALAALPARYRQPVVLHYLEGRERAEVAAELGLSDEALKKRLQRAFEMLRGRLGVAEGASAAVVAALAPSTGGAAHLATAVTTYLHGAPLPAAVAIHVSGGIHAMRLAIAKTSIVTAAAVLAVAAGAPALLRAEASPPVPAASVTRVPDPLPSRDPSLERCRDLAERSWGYLLSSRDASTGAFSPSEYPVAATAYALEACDALDGLPGFQVDPAMRNAAVRWLAHAGDDHDGVLIGTDRIMPMYQHALGTIALARNIERAPEARPALIRAVAIIVGAQGTAGGWRYQPVPRDADISVTGHVVLALCAARRAGIEVPQATLDRAVAYIESLSDPTSGGLTYMGGTEIGYYRTAIGALALRESGDHSQIALRALALVDGTWHENVLFESLADHFALGCLDHDLARRRAWLATRVARLSHDQAQDGAWLPPKAFPFITSAIAIELFAARLRDAR